MGMRVLVCGSRGFNDYITMCVALDAMDDVDTIVEGCARGADRLAEQYGQRHDIPVEHHPADWDRFGRGAGFRRNLEMLDSSVDLVLAFWDGESRGTAHTIQMASSRGIDVVVVKP